MRRPKASPERKQPTPQELLDFLLDFLQRKFYAGHQVAFAKDRPRLLKWVVLWPAKWLNDRGVTIHPDRYRDIFVQVFTDGLRYGDLERITYLPAWLAKTIQSHFEHHGEAYYEEAKSIRNIVEQTMLVTGRPAVAAPDPVRDLAKAASLLRPRKTLKPRFKPHEPTLPGL